MPAEVLVAPAAEAAQRRAAAFLARSGLGPGDRAAFVLPSSAGLVCALLGAARTGIVPVPLNPALTAHERSAILEDAAPALVVDTPDALAGAAR